MVVLRARAETTPGLSPWDVQALVVAITEIVSFALVLVDPNFAPLERLPDGRPARMPKGVHRRFRTETSFRFKQTGAGRGTGDGDFVGFSPNPTVQISINSENAVLFAAENRMRVRRLTYENPLETILEIMLPAAAGGGFIGFLTSLVTLRSTRRQADAEATSQEIANSIAVAQASRDSHEAAERWASMRAATKQSLAQASADESNARLIAAQADALEIENVKRRLLIAQEIEDLPLPGKDLRAGGETQIAGLLRPPVTQTAVEAASGLQPRFTLINTVEDE